MAEPIFLIVDLFCGAGGTTTGFAQAEINGEKIAKVIACVNHDPLAIKSHWANHPEVKHFEEDIRTLDLTELKEVVRFQQSLYPNAFLILWASLECTNFSKAKGGQPRDADSRTLADHLERYVKAIDPDYIQIENVVEFMSWGPLDEKGKPISRKNGIDWMRWRREMCSYGYTDKWQELNSANYGSYTSRNRLFGVFARTGLPIIFPSATHTKNPGERSMYGELLKWKPVKEVLDLNDKGQSILTRKKPLSDRTLNSIYEGLVNVSNGGMKGFLKHYYGNAYNTSIDQPAPTITTKDRCALIQSVIYNPSHGGHTTSTNQPCPVIVARQDKAPLYLFQLTLEGISIPIYNDDSDIMVTIKKFMLKHEIADILMRMLRVDEMLRIQGFPKQYSLVGSQADQKKFIGNSVVPQVVKAWTEAMATRLMNRQKEVRA